jgi:hypothetical protein
VPVSTDESREFVEEHIRFPRRGSLSLKSGGVCRGIQWGRVSRRLRPRRRGLLERTSFASRARSALEGIFDPRPRAQSAIERSSFASRAQSALEWLLLFHGRLTFARGYTPSSSLQAALRPPAMKGIQTGKHVDGKHHGYIMDA